MLATGDAATRQLFGDNWKMPGRGPLGGEKSWVIQAGASSTDSWIQVEWNQYDNI